MVFPFQIDSKWSFIDVIWQIVKYSPRSSSLVEKTEEDSDLLLGNLEV